MSGELDGRPAAASAPGSAPASGASTTLEEQVLVHEHKGPRRVSPFMVPMLMANAASAAVSMRYGYQGPCENTCTACAAGHPVDRQRLPAHRLRPLRRHGHRQLGVDHDPHLHRRVHQHDRHVRRR